VQIHDISPLLSPRTAVWPGDVPFSREVALAQARGDNLDLSSIRTTVHVGAHTDAPSHYVPHGKPIHERALERYLGPCQVITARVGRGQRIRAEHLERAVRSERVLLRTGTFPDPEHFNEDFAALHPSLVHHLAALGVRLLGIDTPSVDLCHDAELLSHHAVAEHDLAILEGIVLTDVADGHYTLVALPLPLEGADASPVRAVLVSGSLTAG